MFMLWLYRYITGYVKFKCCGAFFERFLNLCAQNEINIWESYQENYSLYGHMSVKNYKRIRKIAKKANVRLKVIERHGLVFILHRYRKRQGLAIGFVLFFAVLWFLSSIIWNVNVIGNSNIKTEKILGELEKVGVYQGRWRSSINTELTRQQLLINNPELSWAAINIQGTFATVDVRETTIVADDKEELPCNVVASAGGKIIRIMAYQGIPAVKAGEAVAPGDLLVTGTIQLKTGVTVFRSANAKVIAQTEHELQVFVPFEQIETVREDKCISRSVLTLFSINVPFFTGSVEAPYTSKKSIWQPEVSDVNLPIKITTVKFYKTHENTYTINEQKAKELAQSQMKELCKTELGDIVTAELAGNFIVEKKGVRFIQRFVCEEDIAKQENILLNP